MIVTIFKNNRHGINNHNCRQWRKVEDERHSGNTKNRTFAQDIKKKVNIASHKHTVTIEHLELVHIRAYPKFLQHPAIQLFAPLLELNSCTKIEFMLRAKIISFTYLESKWYWSSCSTNGIVSKYFGDEPFPCRMQDTVHVKSTHSERI